MSLGIWGWELKRQCASTPRAGTAMFPFRGKCAMFPFSSHPVYTQSKSISMPRTGASTASLGFTKSPLAYPKLASLLLPDEIGSPTDAVVQLEILEDGVLGPTESRGVGPWHPWAVTYDLQDAGLRDAARQLATYLNVYEYLRFTKSDRAGMEFTPKDLTQKYLPLTPITPLPASGGRFVVKQALTRRWQQRVGEDVSDHYLGPNAAEATFDASVVHVSDFIVGRGLWKKYFLKHCWKRTLSEEVIRLRKLYSTEVGFGSLCLHEED